MQLGLAYGVKIETSAEGAIFAVQDGNLLTQSVGSTNGIKGADEDLLSRIRFKRCDRFVQLSSCCCIHGVSTVLSVDGYYGNAFMRMTDMHRIFLIDHVGDNLTAWIPEVLIGIRDVLPDVCLLTNRALICVFLERHDHSKGDV